MDALVVAPRRMRTSDAQLVGLLHLVQIVDVQLDVYSVQRVRSR